VTVGTLVQVDLQAVAVVLDFMDPLAPTGAFDFRVASGGEINLGISETTDQHYYHGFNVKRAARLQELEEMAAKLIATARELPGAAAPLTTPLSLRREP
jgi:hypothetical protein